MNKELQYGMIHNTDKNSTILLKAHTRRLPHPGWEYQGHLSRSDTQAKTWRKSKNWPAIKDKSVPDRISEVQNDRRHDLFMQLKEFQHGWSVKYKGKNGER